MDLNGSESPMAWGPRWQMRVLAICAAAALLTGIIGFLQHGDSLFAAVYQTLQMFFLESLDLPIAHGEGKFVPADHDVLKELWSSDRVAFTYATHEPGPDESFLGNPNGSVGDIAGICDDTGLILGLMPHPERHVTPVQHPNWSTRGRLDAEGAGGRVFRNGVQFAISSATTRTYV